MINLGIHFLAFLEEFKEAGKDCKIAWRCMMLSVLLSASLFLAVDSPQAQPAKEEPLSFADLATPLDIPYYLEFGITFGLDCYSSIPDPQLRSFPAKLVQALQGNKAEDRALLQTGALKESKPPKIEDRKAGKVEKLGNCPKIEIDHVNNRIFRKDKIQWSTLLKGYLGGVRPPHIAWDAKRVYVTNNGGITALNVKTGVELWRSEGPEQRLHLSGDLLLATNGPVIAARRVTNGTEVFKIDLGANFFEPEKLLELSGLFAAHPLWRNDLCVLFDRSGKICRQLKSRVLSGILHKNERVLLTSSGVIKLSRTHDIKVLIPFDKSPGINFWTIEGGVEILPKGDALVFRYCADADWGVEVMRVGLSEGKVVWKSYCEGLGVEHEGEYEQKVSVRAAGDQITVCSNGTGGMFIETLDLKSGKKLDRTQKIEDE